MYFCSRLATVKDTASVVVISLDLTAKIYPIIYSIDKLPYDCLKLVAMPKPVAGVLVIAANSLLHVSQGSPGVGVSVNGYTKKTTDFAGMIYKDKLIDLGMSLDGAKALTFGGDRCLIFLQNGSWAVVQMEMDGSKVIGMDIKEIQNTGTDSPIATIPSCVTHVKYGDYFFLGSRVGDSLLIKWKYNKEKLDENFSVCDTLLNTGPILDLAIGDVESIQKEQDEAIPDLELVSCSGYGKNGSLCVFQRHIYPQTTFSFTQSDCQAIWSIKCRKETERRTSVGSIDKSTRYENDGSEDAFDKLLFISKSKSTMVLSAGDELQELVKTGFYTRGATIAVGTLFDDTRIVQVYSTGVMILTPEGRRKGTIPVRSKIIDVSIRDPYILLLLDNNKILALQGNPETKEISSIQLPSLVNKSSIAMASIFADTTGLFSSIGDKKAAVTKAMSQQKKRKAEDENGVISKKPHLNQSLGAIPEFDEVDMDLYGEELDVPAPVTQTKSAPVTIENMDDDDEMLYGTDDKMLKESASEQIDGPVDESNVSLQGNNLNEIIRVSFWALVYTTEGTLQIYSLPDFKEYFTCPQFHIAPDLVTDNHDTPKDKKNGAVIQELLMANIGKERKDPHLIARTNTNDIIVYKAFSYTPTENSDPDRLALRFSRVHHEYVSRKSKTTAEETKKSKKKEIIDEFEIPDLDLDDDEDTETALKSEKRREKLLIPFNDVAGYTGVFVAGAQPAWLMNSCKSFVRVHPMKTDNDIVGFTQFHNVNCKHGFITMDSKSTVRLSSLRTDGVIYDLDWVMQKIPLGRTVHKIEYHPVMRVYAVIVSTSHQVKVHEEEPAEGDTPASEERQLGEFLPDVDKFSMVMVSPVTWEIVDTVEFEEFEQCFSLQCASLESKQTNTGLKHFIVVGTGFLKGEDTTMRGAVR